MNCRNGVWRVQDSLAVSRAIGDENMKKWVISEPETCKLKLTSECEFLIMASDGLWDKVSVYIYICMQNLISLYIKVNVTLISLS